MAAALTRCASPACVAGAMTSTRPVAGFSQPENLGLGIARRQVRGSIESLAASTRVSDHDDDFRAGRSQPTLGGDCRASGATRNPRTPRGCLNATTATTPRPT
jgi:hypothetical protein